MLPQLNLTNHFQIRTHNTHTHTEKKTKLHFPQFQSIRALIFTSHSSNSTEFTLKSNVTTSGLHVVECYMETVTVEENGRESATDILISKQIADPVVYKLARVEGDGRLVPATDDEVMEAEFLDGNSSVHHVLDTGETGVCTMDDDAFDEGFMSIDCEGLLNFDDPSTHGGRSDAVVDTTVDLAKLNPQFEEIPRLESTLVDGEIDQSVDIKQADLPIGSTESEASTSTMCASLQPDFSKLRGEICLDDLSVRELQATFKATFGRETSVKDKQWLKRRISMGLSNSCDVSATTFRIENNRVAKKGKREHYNNEDEIHNKDPLVGFGGRNARGRKAHNINKSAGQTIQLEDHFSGSSKSLKCDTSNLHIPSDDNQGAKRVRKPTKRYIEEASEPDSGESGGKLVSSVRSSGHGPRTRDRPIHNIQPVRKPLVTRQDSLGGSGVEIPYVSRIRRGRPRENYLALMEFQSCGMGMASELVKKSHDDHEFQSDNEIENHKVKVEPPTGWMQQPVLIKEEGENERYSEQSEDLNNESDEGLINSYADDSDDNISTVPTAKGGMRRKHHRPWTLSEVVKLVEGVSRHGAGRWSEIKRISFPTCAHRTAVDLKDKWRNLLRASFTQLPADKGVQNSKKQQSIPIPAPILLRVRELAKLQGHIIPHVRPDLRAVKFGGHNTSSRHVNDIRSGFL